MDDSTWLRPQGTTGPTPPTPGSDEGALHAWRPVLPFAALLAAAYILPVAGPASTGLWMFALLLVNPLVTFVVTAWAGLALGFHWRLLPLAALAWVPAALAVYSDATLMYAAGYAVFALAGLGFGAGIRGLTRLRATSPRPPARSSGDVGALDSPSVRCVDA